MAYKKRITAGHRISVETYEADDTAYVPPSIEDIELGRLSQADYNGPDRIVWQRATCSCNWSTDWLPHGEVTQLVSTHGDPS